MCPKIACLHFEQSYETLLELDVLKNCGYASILPRVPASSHLVPSKAFAVLSTLFFDGDSVTSPLFTSWHARGLVLDCLSKLFTFIFSIQMD